jgi:hypothetical protein
MNNEVKLELAELITDQSKLLSLISQLPAHALKQYPALQKHLAIQSEKAKELNSAIKNGKFTEKEWDLELYRLLDILGYEMVQTIDISSLSNKVINLVGADISAIESLTIQDIGADVLSELLIKMTNSVIDNTKIKIVRYPWLAEKGRIDFGFYRNLDKVFDAYQDGFSSHYKLDQWTQDKLDTRCPQSVPKFFKEHGDPREIRAWTDWIK